jgi:hypothetical protein
VLERLRHLEGENFHEYTGTARRLRRIGIGETSISLDANIAR